MKKRNFRDLSYLVNEEGLRLRPGLFFRSAALIKLNAKEAAFIEDKGIAIVLDLRTPMEKDKKPDTVLDGIEYRHIPVLKKTTFGVTHEKGLKSYGEPPIMPVLYAKIVTEESSIEGLRDALHAIYSTKPGQPILWHCTAGKDRAGIVTALFLSSLGYKKEDIIADYQLSHAISEKKGRKYRRLIRYLLFRFKTANAVYKAMLALPEYLEAAFDAIDDKFGSMQTYLKKQMSITKEMVETFKKTFMEAAE